MHVSPATSYRKLRLRILKITSSLSFSFLHLHGSFRLAFLGQIFVVSSIVFPWFAFNEGIEGLQDYYVFSKFLGGLGFFLVLSIVGSIILMFSYSIKEILKQKLGIRVSDAAVMIFFGVFQIAILVMGLTFIRSLSHFTKDIAFYNAPVFSVVGSILLMVGGVLAYREQKKAVLNSLYIENNPTTDAQFEEYRAILEKDSDKNMILPI
ncbi:MAG: hypothetical protein PHU93_00665 [Candidatus Gracilibacteria bacterium]|nr:hypothetical protein [Candidatus Gracilibacteria bacterium]